MFCKHINGKPELSEEHVDFKWIKPDEINDYSTQEGVRKDFEAVKKEIR